jgi:hypothetical protein
VEERVVNAVLAHAHERYRTDLMSRAVVHADAIAGLLVAAALVRPEPSAGMKGGPFSVGTRQARPATRRGRDPPRG